LARSALTRLAASAGRFAAAASFLCASHASGGFGQLLNEARTAAGKRVRDVALAVKRQRGPDISITLISLIENGRLATYDAAYSLAKVLNVDIETALAAAFNSRITHSIDRETVALAAFTSRHRMGKKINLGRVIPVIQIGEPGEDA